MYSKTDNDDDNTMTTTLPFQFQRPLVQQKQELRTNKIRQESLQELDPHHADHQLRVQLALQYQAAQGGAGVLAFWRSCSFSFRGKLMCSNYFELAVKSGKGALQGSNLDKSYAYLICFLRVF